MRICLIATEIFAWGKHGGFGRATRLIGRSLAARGVRVFAVVPQRPGQAPVETLDGITVLGFPPRRPQRMAELFREADADVYHSCEPSLGTWLAQRTMPHRRHMVTVRDPRDLRDWSMELVRPSLSHGQVLANYLFESSPLVTAAVRRADAVYTTARSLVAKVARMYRPRAAPRFLPTPVEVPAAQGKSDGPVVCFVGRLDRRKRPRLFFELAREFPEIRFVAMGKSRDARYEERLRSRYGGLANLDLLGFVDPFTSDVHSRTLSDSWIAVNTSTREGLPNAFLEAAAHGCAILSAVDPDGFASLFGRHAAADGFGPGLAWLIEGQRWAALGQLGRRHVGEQFGLDRAIDLHLVAYRELLDRPGAATGPTVTTTVAANSGPSVVP